MHPRIALLVKEELEKLLEFKFIQPIQYVPNIWISNMVLVSNPNVDIRVYTNFQDLNKACPKDDFPLPNIDILVDLTAGHEMLTLMDGFVGYSQTKIPEEDKHKTAFTTPQGTFFYQVIPIRLKNAGTTYQCTMIVIFHDLMHKVMEDYVDDILCKSKTRAEHLAILEQIFECVAK